ncbi:hypothetical protein LCGC14_1011040 [marine sediment metagenome]|uniref:Uncharacterized protein n=1 Tax=marine sediment metagenome TaxID=412755 RepID=A0A0F9NLM9_9ZZZZ
MSYKLSIRITSEEDSHHYGDWTLLSLTDEEARIVKDSALTRDVTRSLWRKQIDGAKEHGHVMNAGDHVDAIQNAFEEALDLSQYLMKELQERDSG